MMAGTSSARLLLTLTLCLLTTWGSAAETEIQFLSGTGPDDAVEWDFFCTAGRHSGVWTKIPVPSCWEQHGFGSYNYGGDLLTADRPLAMEQGLYRHEFTVPGGWRDRTVRIVFEGSMTDTEVRINGQQAGPVHQGAFYRYHHDVTGLLRFGETNLLEVTVAKVSANPSVNAAERAADYWIFGGIFRPVWLEAHPRPFIDWTAIDARADGSFRAEVHLGAPAGHAEAEARVTDTEGRPVGAPLVAPVSSDGMTAVVEGRVEGISPWTAETPTLYDVHFTLRGQASAGDGSEGPRHTVRERFGFRTVEVRAGDGVYLNGQRIVLKGVNRHCFWPETARTVSREQSWADARLIKEANLNAVRMSHYPPDEHFLEACDELGLYVLDELAGWQAAYNTPTGRRLIGQMIRRDVNHPSILFWDNGNEGGWNEENDGEFARWDPQKRAVLHPWGVSGGINTDHYEAWESHVGLTNGPEIYMPTEVLHGLYDGGIGAGLRDYWDAVKASATAAGAFFWVFADEGVVRTDQDGRIDNVGNRAADGMVGPHREKEGSFFSVKEILSPVQVEAPTSLSADWDGTVTLANAYDFTSLDRCRFSWRTTRFPAPVDGRAGHEVIAEGTLAGPPVPPGSTGTVRLPLPDDWPDADAVGLTATDREGRELWTWSWPTPDARTRVARHTLAASTSPVRVSREDGGGVEVVQAGDLTLRFDTTTGLLLGVVRGEEPLSLGGGPRLLAYRRHDRVFENLGTGARLVDFSTEAHSGEAVVSARYSEGLREVRWTIGGDGRVRLDFEYSFDGEIDMLGVGFDYPEAQVRKKRWLGRGPYRVYRNRLEGGVLDVWEVDFNDPVPGETYAYPEFKGAFRDWQWLALETREGPFVVENISSVPYLGLYKPRMGADGLLDLPEIGLAFLDVIPAQRTKFITSDDLGPQSRRPRASGTRRGRLLFHLLPPR